MNRNFLTDPPEPSALTLVDGSGPAYAPAAKADHGLLTDVPTAYAVRPTTGEARARLRECSIRVEANSELVYVVFPEFDAGAFDPLDRFRSSAIAIDVVFDDGTRLLADAGLVDHHGLPCDAAGSFASHALSPDQWNLRRVALAAHAGRTAIALEVVALGHRRPLAGWIDGADIRQARMIDRSRPPVELVDTRRGSHSSPTLSRGNTPPLTAVPHGFTFVTPMTDTSNQHWNYAWVGHGPGRRPRLEAMAISHTPSLWVGDRGVLLVRPIVEGSMEFEHDDETARPNEYSVRLQNGSRASASATEHCVVMDFEFPLSGALRIDWLHEGAVTLKRGADGIHGSGWVDSVSPHHQRLQRMFFDLVIDDPHAAVDRELVTLASSAATVRIGTSFISIEVAREARERELAQPVTLGATAATAADRWNELLGRVAVDGATDDQLATLYGNLYRLFLYPNRLTEQVHGKPVHADPNLPPSDENLPIPGAMLTNNGFWDTYRTAWPAYFLLEPDHAGELVDGFLQHVREGGWTPRWAAPGFVDAMVGTSLDAVLADAVAKGIDGFSPEEAYDAGVRDATVKPPSRLVGRKGLRSALFRGWVDDSLPEALSWTMEGAINDASLALFSDALAEAEGPRASEFRDNARYFASRGLTHRSLFDRSTGFFRDRSAIGEHPEPFDPRKWGHGYTETNAWGMAFSAPQDGPGLAEFHGGPSGLRRALDRFFAEPETGEAEFAGSYPGVIHEMTEARDLRMGMWGLSNQPAHHIPWMYAFTDAPHRAASLVREALGRLFTGSEIGQGYPGDEDNGEMSAWWLFAAMGFYPLFPGSGEYVIGSPLFPRLILEVPGGAHIEIVASGGSPTAVHVQAVMVDEMPWTSIAIPHAVLVAASRIEFLMGESPFDWASGRPASISARPRLADATAPGGARPAFLVDDVAATSRTFVTGETIAITAAPDSEIQLCTLTVETAGSFGWRLESSNGDERWSVADERHGERFRWDRQTRPFSIAPRSAEHWRLVITGDDVVLAQVELLREA